MLGRWEVISLDVEKHKGHIQVRVRCLCGFERNMPRSYLTRPTRASRQCQSCARKQSAFQKFGARRFYKDD